MKQCCKAVSHHCKVIFQSCKCVLQWCEPKLHKTDNKLKNDNQHTNMMKKILLLCAAIIAFVSCNNYGANYSNDSTPADTTPYEESNIDPLLNEMIEVDVSYAPRTELTDEIRNTTLIQLIRKDTRELRTNDPLSYFFEGRVKSVPASSNLAKVYYIDCPQAFFALNHEFYRKAKYPEPKEVNRTDTWKEYL